MFNIDILAQLPIASRIAAACDKGMDFSAVTGL